MVVYAMMCMEREPGENDLVGGVVSVDSDGRVG